MLEYDYPLFRLMIATIRRLERLKITEKNVNFVYEMSSASIRCLLNDYSGPGLEDRNELSIRHYKGKTVMTELCQGF